MKRLIRIAALASALVMLIAAAMPVYADTIIDYVLYTDIRTYIGGVEISSYNINGYTAVVVEDLANYGFDVVWNGSARTLTAKRAVGKAVTGSAVSSTSGGKVGDRAMPVYATDIKTYFDGVEFKSYNVGGKTIVYVDDLANKYSSAYDWNQSAKTLKVTLSDKAPEPPVKLMDTDVLYWGKGLKKYTKEIGESFTIAGNTYYEGFVLDHNINWGGNEATIALLNLDKKYTTFVFDVGRKGTFYDNYKNATIKIFVDEVLISEYEIDYSATYETIMVPVSNAKALRIEMCARGNSYSFFNCLLYPASNVKQDTIDTANAINLMSINAVYDGKGLTKYTLENGKSFNVAGKKYYEGFVLDHNINWGSNDCPKALINLDKKYSSITFDVGRSGTFYDNYHDAQIKIFVDNSIVSEYTVKYSETYQRITVPLNYASSMRIESYSRGNAYGFYNCFLYK